MPGSADIELLKFDKLAHQKQVESNKSNEKTSRFEKYKRLAKMSEGNSENSDMKRTNSCTRLRSELS